MRTARPGERLRTLDGEDRELSLETLLITDDSGPIALAGVMGGQATEVTEATTAYPPRGGALRAREHSPHLDAAAPA